MDHIVVVPDCTARWYNKLPGSADVGLHWSLVVQILQGGLATKRTHLLRCKCTSVGAGDCTKAIIICKCEMSLYIVVIPAITLDGLNELIECGA